VIPFGGWLASGIVFLVCFSTMSLIFFKHAPLWMKFLLIIVAPLAMAGYSLLIGYVYGDARRRGMRYVMWTLLAIFLTNGIGIILYFILRDPLLVYCSRCGAGVQPACQACHRIIQPGWTHCAWCGNPL
jgi:hypothetical protein